MPACVPWSGLQREITLHRDHVSLPSGTSLAPATSPRASTCSQCHGVRTVGVQCWYTRLSMQPRSFRDCAAMAKRSYQCRVSVQTSDAVCQWQGASDIDIDLQDTLPPGLPDPRPVIPSDLIVPPCRYWRIERDSSATRRWPASHTGLVPIWH